VERTCLDAAPDLLRHPEHLATCAACRATADAVALVAASADEPAPDLWPRLRTRIAATEAATHVHLRLPAIGWRAAAAIAMVAAVPLLAPEPGRLLAVFLGMV
jgi:hypothetical protein